MHLSLPKHDADLPTRRRLLQERAEAYAFTTFKDIPIGEQFHERDKASLGWVEQLLRTIYRGRHNLEAYLKVSGKRFKSPLPEASQLELASALNRKDFQTLLNHYLPDLGCVEGGGRPRSLDEYRQIFQKEPLPRIADVFLEDWVFARSFVAGPNPLMLTRLEQPLAKLPVTDDMFRRGKDLEGDSLHRAVGEGRVFIADYEIIDLLRAGAHPEQPKFLCRPIVMLAVPRGQTSLVPVAIQGGQAPGAPIFTPADGWAWQMAKQAVRSADGCYQELLTHLGFTHLIVEPFAVATRRCLSERHPIHHLLDQHLEGTLPINSLAVKRLIQPEQAVDRLLGADILSAHELLRRERLAYRFRDHFLPVELRARGLDDADRLPDHPYRDDASRVWRAISRWVSGYVEHYYLDDAAILQDEELQAWAHELADPAKGALKELTPGGGITTVSALKDVLTMVLFTASAQHAAANFAQKTDMAFAPAYPLATFAPFPASTAVTEQDFLSTLPPLDVALRTEQTLVFLGSLHHGKLGHYGPFYFREPVILALMKRFLDELDEAESAIAERNERLRLPYVHLLPSLIPQSINI